VNINLVQCIPLYICYEYLFSVISLNLNATQDKRDNGSELGSGLVSGISFELVIKANPFYQNINYLY